MRNAARRTEILGPRRSTAKTMVKNAIEVATSPTDGQDPATALAAAMSALDRAAKAGAIHPNAAARRKSRLTLRVNDLLGGTVTAAGGRAKQVGRTAAQKAAKARIAAGKAGKAKGAQTAAGKARAALSKSTRAEAAAEAAATTKTAAKPAAAKPATAKATPKPAAKKTTTAKAKAPTTKAAPKK